MRYWLIICINLFGISGIIGITYLIIWFISKLKDSFKLHVNGVLIGALVSFALALASFTTGITLSIPEDLFFAILVIAFCTLLALSFATISIVFIVFYSSSLRIDENSVRFIEQPKM